MKNIILIILFNILAFLNSFAQVTPVWMQRYNSFNNTNDWASDMTLDSSGNVYVTGWTAGTTTLKYNKDGQLVWHKFINELYLYPRNITFSKSGKVYVSCIVDWGGWVIIKYDSSGNFIWSREFSNGVGSVNEPTAYLLDENENSYMTGTILDSGYKKVGFVKYDSSGTLIWTKLFNRYYGGYMNGSTSIIMDGNKNIIIGGYFNVRPVTICNPLIIKYSYTGEQLWSALYDTSNYTSNKGVKIICDKQNNIIVGSDIVDTSLNFHIGLLKYSQNGILIWSKYFAGPSRFDNTKDLKSDIKDNIYLLVQSGDSSTGGYGYSTQKYDSSGNYKWERRYNGNFVNEAVPSCLYVDSLSNSYVTGSTVTLKYNSNGRLLWLVNNTTWTNEYYNLGIALKLDRLNNVYIFGNGYSSLSQSEDFLIVKYSQTVGINNHIEIINNYKLYQNYPNPFNSTTNIKYQISKNSNVNIKIYNILGKEIETLVNSFKKVGMYEIIWDASNYSSGIYFYKLTVGDSEASSGQVYTETKRMMLIK